MEDKSNLLNEEVAVRGEIRNGSINETTMTFILEGSDFDLLVDYSNADQFPMDWVTIELFTLKEFPGF